jgi:hypothetical protein
MNKLTLLREKIETALNCVQGTNILVEVRLTTLMNSAQGVVKRRAQPYNVTFRVRMLQKEKDKYYFWVKKPGSKKYRVNIEFVGNKENQLDDDVRVSCTCGYWKYWGPDYNSVENDYNLRKMSDGSPPDIRDPHREHWICKHTYAASRVLVDYLKSLQKRS